MRRRLTFDLSIDFDSGLTSKAILGLTLGLSVALASPLALGAELPPAAATPATSAPAAARQASPAPAEPGSPGHPDARRRVADATPAPACDPRDSQELAAAALAAQAARDLAGGAALFALASERAPDDPVVAYNAACLAALAGLAEQAFTLLDRAVTAGYRNQTALAADPDLTSLHVDPLWSTLLARLERLRAEEARRNGGAAFATAWRPDLPMAEKLAGLALLWSEARSNFANFDLVPELDWDAAYLAALPRVLATTSTLTYYRELRAFYALLADGHTLVHYPRELRPEVSGRPLLATRRFTDRVAIVALHDPTLAALGLAVGQEVRTIDGVPVDAYAEREVQPLTAASTPQDLAVRVYQYDLLAGPVDRPVRLTVADAAGNQREVSVPRASRETFQAAARRPPFTLTTLPGNVAHVALTTFDDPAVADAFAAAFADITSHAALLLDVRDNGGGNSGHAWRILAHLTDRPFATSAWSTRVLRPALRAWGFGEGRYGGSSTRPGASDGRVLRGPVALLTSARTYSAAEDFAVAFDVMERGPIVGEPTGGSTGQPLFLDLPGGGRAQICTKRDTYPDGREFVGRGVQPDVLVVPTLEDLRAGRDPALAAALAALGAGGS